MSVTKRTETILRTAVNQHVAMLQPALYTALKNNASLEIIVGLISAWPEAVKVTCEPHCFPVHIALKNKAPLAVVDALIRAWPDVAKVVQDTKLQPSAAAIGNVFEVALNGLPGSVMWHTPPVFGKLLAVVPPVFELYTPLEFEGPGFKISGMIGSRNCAKDTVIETNGIYYQTSKKIHGKPVYAKVDDRDYSCYSDADGCWTFSSRGYMTKDGRKSGHARAVKKHLPSPTSATLWEVYFQNRSIYAHDPTSTKWETQTEVKVLELTSDQMKQLQVTTFKIEITKGNSIMQVGTVIPKVNSWHLEKEVQPTMLHFALKHDVSLDVFKLILAVHPDAVEARDKLGDAPMHIAVKAQHLRHQYAVVQCLLAVRPSSILILNNMNHTPLDCLLDQQIHGVEPDLSTEDGQIIRTLRSAEITLVSLAYLYESFQATDETPSEKWSQFNHRIHAFKKKVGKTASDKALWIGSSNDVLRAKSKEVAKIHKRRAVKMQEKEKRAEQFLVENRRPLTQVPRRTLPPRPSQHKQPTQPQLQPALRQATQRRRRPLPQPQPPGTVSHLEQLVASVGNQSDEAALSDQLSPIKNILSIGLQTELEFASANLYISCDFKVYKDLYLAPIIEVILKSLRAMAAKVDKDPDSYRVLLFGLKRSDKIIYDESFKKCSQPPYGDSDGYDKMLVRCAALQEECDFAVVQSQPTKDLIPLVLMSRERIPAYKAMIARILVEARGACISLDAAVVVKVIYRPGDETKSPYRMIEKAFTKGPNRDYPDCSKIFDVFGCIVVCSDYAMMTAVVDTLANQHKRGVIQIVRIKDRWTVPSDGGWRDFMVNVVIDKVVFEVQVVLQAMLKVRGTLDGHAAYNQFRCFFEVFGLLGLSTDIVNPDRDPSLDFSSDTIRISAILPPIPMPADAPKKKKRRKTTKFVAPAIRLGNAVAAATGLADLMGIDESTIGNFLEQKISAIEAEFQEHGNAEDKRNFIAVLDGTYQNPPDAEGNADTTPQKTIEELMQSPQVRTAKLGRHHVVALRLYTTSSFDSINKPLRADPPVQPNPFAATTYFISEAIKKLRAVAAKRPDAFTPVVLWRGLKGMGLPKKFEEEGGTEFGCMSTSASKDVAIEFSESEHPLVFKYVIDNCMSCGVDISFLSAYPEEQEALFPPLTYLSVVKLSVEVVNYTRVLVASVRPTFPS